MNIYSPVIVGPTSSDSSYTGTSFVKIGGLSNQFLMADGSTSAGTVLTITEHSASDFDYTPVWSSGNNLYITATKLKFNPALGRMSANSFLKIGGTSAQILTADGGIKVLGTGATDVAAGNHLHTGVYEPVITAGTTAQYWRGDKSWQTFPTIPTVTPSALTRTNDTNVTLTLGGTPTTALLQATSITVGWTGTLADARITSAATWNAKEPGLGNPSVSGYVLSSTTAGVRSWVAMTGGTDTNTYPTTFTWTGGTTAGPTGSLTGTSPAVSFAAIPVASATASGVINTTTQSIAGNKTFTGTISATNLGTVSALNTNASTTQFLRGDGTWQTPSGSSLPYKIYVALLTQIGTAAPTVSILQNTLSGSPVWTRIQAGVYRATLANEFTQGKSTMFVSTTYYSTVSGVNQVTCNSGLSPNSVQVVSFNRSLVLADDLLTNTEVEIRVYP